MTQSIPQVSPSVAMPSANEVPKSSSWHHNMIELLAGGTAGAAGIFAAAPAMRIKVFMQEKSKEREQAKQQNLQPSTVVKTLSQSVALLKNPSKLFGGAPTLAGWMFPQTAFAFWMKDQLCQQVSHQGEKKLSKWEELACSTATGAMASVFVTPQELIWTQKVKADELREKMIKEQNLDPKTVPVKTSIQITQGIWEKHGVKGFFRALPETTMREMVSTSVLTSLAKDYPFLAPVAGSMISQPADVYKTYKQADFNYKAAFSELFTRKAFSGLGSRTIVYLIFMNVAPHVKDFVVSQIDE